MAHCFVTGQQDVNLIVLSTTNRAAPAKLRIVRSADGAACDDDEGCDQMSAPNRVRVMNRDDL